MVKCGSKDFFDFFYQILLFEIKGAPGTWRAYFHRRAQCFFFYGLVLISTTY